MDYLERIADEWRDRAAELADWTQRHLVNRTDVWGRYVRKKKNDSEEEFRNSAITAPFRDERGKVFLAESSLEKHFRTKASNGVLGLHSSSTDQTSRWLAIDVDLHEPDDLSVTPQGNFVAARAWYTKLQELGLDPLLFDSNGIGGFHLLVVFAEPLSTQTVHDFAAQLVSDFEMRGLDQMPEIFPGTSRWNHYGSWLRLPGRHHSRDHYTRVWNDEPWDDDHWLCGHDAIDRILRTRLASFETAQQHGIERRRRTVCLDFDGVIHSYTSGWCGESIIPDAPIHGTRAAIERLRKRYRIVVHSARCCSEEGCEAIAAWLKKYEIEVDEVCRHKPPATVYLDDRAVPFKGDWDEAIAAINDFRR
jgi:hypothetical protein